MQDGRRIVGGEVKSVQAAIENYTYFSETGAIGLFQLLVL
jgi:hypothetical protein